MPESNLYEHLHIYYSNMVFIKEQQLQKARLHVYRISDSPTLLKISNCRFNSDVIFIINIFNMQILFHIYEYAYIYINLLLFENSKFIYFKICKPCLKVKTFLLMSLQKKLIVV